MLTFSFFVLTSFSRLHYFFFELLLPISIIFIFYCKFHDECYDLNKDGIYVASSHPRYDHEVKIAVYNDYMREIQVVDRSGEIMLSITNQGEIVNNDYPYRFRQETKNCPLGLKDCLYEYTEFKFDAQNFEYVVI